MNLAENLSLSAAKTPEAAAVRLDDEVRSYRALDDASARVAGLLASRGVGPGDRVGIMLPNVPLFPIIYYGILRLGATVVPMNVLLKGRETAHYLKDPGAKAVFAWQAFAEHAQTGAAEAGAECIEAEPEGFARLLQDAEPHTAVTPRDGSETAVILYTSGTTGVPKGAELSHDNLAHNCRAAAGLFGIGAATVTLGALPLFHSFGTAASLGFKPQWILQGPAFVEQLITKDGSLKATPTPVAAALKGALVTSFSAPWDDPDAPGMRQLVADHDKYEPGAPPSIYFALAYASGKVQAEILRKAIANGDLSRAGILKAKLNLGKVDLGGVSPSPTYTEKGGPPSTKTLITRIDPSVDGFLKPVEKAYGSEIADGLGTGE